MDYFLRYFYEAFGIEAMNNPHLVLGQAYTYLGGNIVSFCNIWIPAFLSVFAVLALVKLGKRIFTTLGK